MNTEFTIMGSDGKAFSITREQFQMLHSSARAVYRQSIDSSEIDSFTAEFLIKLNDAIELGHDILGTDRSTADNYIKLVGEVARLHEDQARRILEREGLLQKTE